MKALLYSLGLLSLVNPAKATWNFEIAPYLWALGKMNLYGPVAGFAYRC